MKKRNVTALSEILANDNNVAANLTEDMQQFMFNKILDIPSGLVFGLSVTQDGASGFSVASGALIDLTLSYGELEGTSGVSLTTIPVSGTRTDTISARFLEVADSPGASYTIIDVESRTQTTENVYRRKFGSVQLEVFEDTASGALTGNRQALASVSVTSGGIQSITDLRTFVKPRNVDLDSLNAELLAIIAGAPVGGDVSGTVGDATVIAINGIPVSGSGVSGQVLALNSDLSAFEYVTPAGASDLSTYLNESDLSSTIPNPVSGTANAGSGTDVARANHVHYSPYEVAGGCVGAPAASGFVLNFVSAQSWSVPASGVGCYAIAQTAATASGVFTIYKNGASSGTITFAAAGTTGTWSGFSAISLVAGDVLTIKAPTTADTTLADIGITIKGVLA